MKSFFKDLFEYNRQVNDDLIQAMLKQKDLISERALKLINHIVNVQELYNCRITQEGKPPASWDIRPLEELAAINENNSRITSDILQRFDFDAMIHYTTVKGTPMTHSILDALFHVINHSTYHRGQIATNFRETGLEPLITDWVIWRRK
jgi:uncharacterized damage-inducible protein DinB